MTRHNKRYEAPTEKWGIPTKKFFWAPKEKPGPHPSERSIPLKVILRDILEYSNTSREAKRILAERKIKVDGKVVTDGERPTGLMDVISMVALDENYRVLFDQRGRIRLIPINESQAGWKLVKIEDKTSLKGGLIQYNFHDGRNLRLEDENKFDTNDVLKIQLPSQDILESYEFEDGVMALVTGGEHIGEIGAIEELEMIKGPQPNFVHFESGISTIEKYTFVIGKDTPVIEIPEVGIV